MNQKTLKQGYNKLQRDSQHFYLQVSVGHHALNKGINSKSVRHKVWLPEKTLYDVSTQSLQQS